MHSCSHHLTSVTSCRIFGNQKVNLRSSLAVGKLPDAEIVRQINEAQSRLHHSSFLPYSGVEDAEGLPRLACLLQGYTLPARTPFVLIDGPDDMLHSFFFFLFFFFNFCVRFCFLFNPIAKSFSISYLSIYLFFIFFHLATIPCLY